MRGQSSQPRREFLRHIVSAAATVPLASSSWLRGAVASAVSSASHYKIPPRCTRAAGSQIRLNGPIEHYLEAITNHWLKIAPVSNPAILEMFRDRDRRPLRDMVPWAGEFAGKYLTSAVQVWRTRRDESLGAIISEFVDQLVSGQDADGYLGPWPKDSRLTGHAPNAGKNGGATWDAWGHYHIMLGLLLWHEETGHGPALKAAQRIGDLFCQKFAEKRLVDTGSTEMNLAPIHTLCLLYARTGEARYLALAEKIRDEFAARDKDGKPLAGDYLEAGLSGKEFFQTPKPRWESLHPIMGLAELYWITGDERYRRAFQDLWWSIVKLDRHNNGGFSSGEQAQGNPYHPGAIETCCTIAWIAMSVEMLKLTGNSVVADEIELSTLNSVLGMHSPSGRWVTYNTPMDGVRKASAHDIVFQAREGSPELNCCSVNGARGFGMISHWAVMKDQQGLLVNWYGPGEITVPLRNDSSVTLKQETAYPRESRVRIRVQPSRSQQFSIRLRIPYWSRTTRVTVRGEPVANVAPGQYLTLERKWRRDDIIEIQFDFSFHFWAGEKECEGKVSVFRGPILLTYDRRFNDFDPDDFPALDRQTQAQLVKSDDWLAPIVLVDLVAVNGKKLRLCDFGSAGSGGSPYRSWLAVNGVSKTEFSRENPLRSSP